MGRVPEGGGNFRGGSVAPGPVLVEWWRQEFGIRGMKAVGLTVVLEQASEVVGGLVMRTLNWSHCGTGMYCNLFRDFG